MSPSPDAKRRILVVDDDCALRHALSTLLEEAGHIVLQASDGPEALATLASVPTDLMLLDLGLPGMGGMEVLARVRALASPPRVVVVTADDTPETLLKAIARPGGWLRDKAVCTRRDRRGDRRRAGEAAGGGPAD